MATPLYDRDYCGPSEDAIAIDISSTDHVLNFRRLYVGGTGDVKIVTARGSIVTYQSVPAGFYIDVQGSQVTKTGTTATKMVAEK